jgi:hypothetical protein
MVVIDVIYVHWEAVHTLGDTGIPCAIVDCRIQIVHPRGIWFAFTLLPEYWCIKKDVGDVVQGMVLNFNRIRDAKNLYDISTRESKIMRSHFGMELGIFSLPERSWVQLDDRPDSQYHQRKEQPK